jgi:hypothetical protein
LELLFPEAANIIHGQGCFLWDFAARFGLVVLP